MLRRRNGEGSRRSISRGPLAATFRRTMVWQRVSDSPTVVSLPSSDAGFADAVGVVMASSPWIDHPADLEDALRPYFDDIRVRASDERGGTTWYVDRNADPREGLG